MTATEFQQRKSESHETDSEKVTSQHTFTIDYLGFHNVGENGSCIYVQDGIDNVLKADNQKRTVKMQLLERDILVMFSDTGEVLGRFSYTETSSCGIKDDQTNIFGFIAGNTTCSFADSFDCHVFSSHDPFIARTIIDGIGKGFDRSIYCV
eukprot:TCONS_00049761-protein